MMREHPWGWSPTGRRRWAVVLVLLGHLGWVLMGTSASRRWEGFLAFLIAPARSLSGGIEGWRAARRQRVTDLEAARAEILDLRNRVNIYQGMAQRDAQRLSEAEDAVRLLGLKRLLPLTTVGARVMVNNRRAPFGGLVLDQGSDTFLVPDQGVLCPEGVVGRVWAVGQNQCSVLPLDAYNASTSVMVGRSRATGVLQGTGPGRAQIRYIGPQEVIQVGEPVYTSGLDRVFPRGLLVGYVAFTRQDEEELHLEVDLAAPLDRVHLVLLLPPNPPMQVQPPAQLPQAIPGTPKPAPPKKGAP